MSEMISLSQKDWDVLLPGVKHTLGKTELKIVPLGVEDIGEALEVIDESLDKIIEKGINQENYADPEKAVFITKMIVQKAPGLLSKCSGVQLDDIKKLPLAPCVGLVVKIIEVNLESQEDLEGNLKALVEKMKSLRLLGESETSPTSSSDKDTRSRKSRGTR